ncbi:MAG: patatin-like phospholipase family protein [Bacteroidetes bacterium]|nr:patatin-like phospholipase family protein [Bacteroidota bacterium]
MKEKKTIGLCLSGGGALGFAHIGALQALEERNIFPEYISGASFGAIIGALYSYGYNPLEMRYIVQEKKLYNILNIVKPTHLFRSKGFSSNKKVKRVMKEVIPVERFEDLKKKFALSLVDIAIPQWEIVSSGDKLIDSIMASMSIPVVFEPEIDKSRILVDGGVMNNLPVEPLLEKCDRVIGIDVQNIGTTKKVIDKKTLGQRYYGAMMKEMQKHRVSLCDDYIWFPRLEDYTFYDFRHYQKIMDIGYEGTVKYLDELEKKE